MGKQKEGGAPATWEIDVLFICCDLCIREIELGNRPTTHFSKDGWRNLMNSFNEKTGRTYDCTQLKNKRDQLKKEWKLWKDLLHGETSIGWNPIKKTFDASDELWKDKLQAMPAAKKFKYNGIIPELEERLDKMFERIVAIGNDVWVSNSGVMPPELREEHQESSDASIDEDIHITQTNGFEGIYDGVTQTSQINGPSHIQMKKPKKSRTRGKQTITTQLEELVAAARSVSQSINASNTARASVTIRDALDEIVEYQRYSKISNFMISPQIFCRTKVKEKHSCVYQLIGKFGGLGEDSFVT